MNYYPRYPAHYLIKTIGLTMEQDGAYNRLLDWYYGNERGIPNAERYEISRARNASEKAATDVVLAKFFTLKSGVWINGRTADEIADAQPKIAAARANGRKGGRPKKNLSGSEEKPSGFPNGTQEEPTAKAPQSPILTVDTPSSNTTPAAAPLVGVFEGHPEPRDTPNPVAKYAIALSRAGFQVTSLNPELIAYAEAGGTVEHLQQVAGLAECAGKKAGYVLAIARRELTERAKPITGEANGTRAQGRDGLVDGAKKRADRILEGLQE